MLDLSRKSHREKFKEYLDKQLDFILIEEIIYETMEKECSNDKLEKLD